MARHPTFHPTGAAAALMALAVLAFCAAGGARAQEPGKAGAGLSEPPQTDWRSQVRSLRIGVLSPGGEERELTMAEPFRAHMQETLGLPVKLVPARDMRALIDAIVNGRVDYARMSASAFASGWALCRCLEPLAAPQAADGTRDYRAIAVARTSVAINRLGDLKGKRVIFSEPGSVSGYMVPIAVLRGQGIDTAHYFSAQNHAEGPQTAIAAMLRGDYDAAFAWSSLAGERGEGYSLGPLRRMVAQGRLDMDAIRIIWQSDPIPHPPQVVRANLPEDLKSLIRAALFDLLAAEPEAYDATEPAFSGGFVAVTRDSYTVLLHAFALQ